MHAVEVTFKQTYMILATILDTLSIAEASLALMWSQLVLLNIFFKWTKETKTTA